MVEHFPWKWPLLLIAHGLLSLLAVFYARWRIARKKGGPIDLERTPLLARLTLLELPLLIGMVFMATAMARGL